MIPFPFFAVHLPATEYSYWARPWLIFFLVMHFLYGLAFCVLPGPAIQGVMVWLVALLGLFGVCGEIDIRMLIIWAIMCFMSGLTGLALVLDLGVKDNFSTMGKMMRSCDDADKDVKEQTKGTELEGKDVHFPCGAIGTFGAIMICLGPFIFFIPCYFVYRMYKESSDYVEQGEAQFDQEQQRRATRRQTGFGDGGGGGGGGGERQSLNQGRQRQSQYQAFQGEGRRLGVDE
jgi:hypothetical protein